MVRKIFMNRKIFRFFEPHTHIGICTSDKFFALSMKNHSHERYSVGCQNMKRDKKKMRTLAENRFFFKSHTLNTFSHKKGFDWHSLLFELILDVGTNVF